MLAWFYTLSTLTQLLLAGLFSLVILAGLFLSAAGAVFCFARAVEVGLAEPDEKVCH